MFNNFGSKICNIFKNAEEERYQLKHPYVGTEHLLLSILKNDKELAKLLSEFGLTYDNFKNELLIVVGKSNKKSSYNLYTPMLKRVINNAIDDAKENNDGELTTKHLLSSLIEEGEGIGIRILIGMNIDLDQIYNRIKKDNNVTSKKLELYKTGVLLNGKVSLDEVVYGRDKEISLIIETLLRKKKNNPILIGEAGVGKTATIEELVRRIEKKEVPKELYNKKIISIEMGMLVSGTKYRGEFEEKLTNIIKELENNKDIILFIDEIHSMVNAGGAEGAINASDIFKPALSKGNIKVIGATTRVEYQKYFSKDKALMRRFEVINVCEPSIEETKNILYKIKSEYEKHHNVIISNDNINKIVNYTDKFISNKNNPDKSIDFLDSVCSRVKTNNDNNNLIKKIDLLEKNKIKAVNNKNYKTAIKIYKEKSKLENIINNSKKLYIKDEDIISVIESKTNMLLNINNLSFINNIKMDVNKNLYNMNDYTNKICNCIKDNIKNKDGFLKILLNGEKYLGKSSLINIITRNIPCNNIIKIDLNEYKNNIDIYKLIGSINYEEDYIFNKLKSNNFYIIIFDNYNEACDNIKNLIKEILKEKVIKDSKGDNINFNNTYIFLINNINKKNSIGFINNQDNIINTDISDLMDLCINIKSLDYNTLNSYLDSLNILNKDEIIRESEYLKYNYKNINKLIKNEKLVRN